MIQGNLITIVNYYKANKQTINKKTPIPTGTLFPGIQYPYNEYFVTNKIMTIER